MTKILDTMEILRETPLEFPEKIWLKYKNTYKQDTQDKEDDLKTSDTFKQVLHAYKENQNIVETYNNSVKVQINPPVELDNDEEKNINIFKNPEESKSSDSSFTSITVKEE